MTIPIMGRQQMEFLLVEDNDTDIELIRLAFEEQGVSCRLSITHTGVEAIEFLHHRVGQLNSSMPTLILLDINMPLMNGKQFLEVIRRDPKLSAIPVLLFTSSDASHDINDCYRLRANGYLIKPSNAYERLVMVEHIAEFLNALYLDAVSNG